MIKNKHLWTGLGIGMIASAGLLVSCSQDEDDVSMEQQEITFNSAMPVREYITRGALKDFYKNFKIFGTKTMEGASTPTNMMSNYGMAYVDDAWQYVTGRQSIYTGQIEKYWDYMATEYHFVAGSPYNVTTINSESELKISGLQATSASTTDYTIVTNYFFSDPTKVVKADYNKIVDMVFRPAMTQVIVAFVFAEDQTEPQMLSNITFNPKTGGTYNSKGDIKFTYDFTGDCSYEYEVTSPTTSSTPLGFESVTLGVPCTTATPSQTVWYMLPYSTDDTGVSPWIMTVGSLTDNNTAEVPAGYMHWQPGYKYVYIFRLSNAETDPTLKFVNVIQMAVTGWEESTATPINIWNW